MRIAVLFLILTSAARGADLERVVDDGVAAAVRDGKFAGVVLVAMDGETLVRKAYGLADRERGLAHTPGTPFMVMSVSKQFTAALILRLVAQGRLRLDDRVDTYLANWPVEWDRVTIHDLLTHSAGTEIDTTFFWLIRHHPEYWPEPGPRPPYEPRPLLTAPGTTFLYSNVGYTLLTRIAATVGGKPFDQLIREEVFCPLDLTETQPQREAAIPGRARGYRRTADGLELWEQKTIDIIGAGDVVTTAGDLAKWNEAMSDDRFLPASLRARMLTPHVAGKWGGIGYGWFLMSGCDGRMLQFHGGSGAGFRAWNFRVSEGGLTVIVLSNIVASDTQWVTALRLALAAAYDERRMIGTP